MKPAKAIRLRHTCFTFAIMFAAPILSSHASVFARENLSFEISVALSKTSALGPEDGTDSLAPQKKALTVEDVVSMVKAGISDELVASRIRAENRAFDLSPEQIIRLKKEGVSDAIIKLMIDPKTEEKGGLASGVTGKYYDKQRPAEYLELNPDHTFYRSAGGGGITGTYQLNGNEITLNLQAMGTNMAFKGNVEGDRITMEEPGAFAGKVTTIYVRRNANSNVGSVASKNLAQPPVLPKASCADYNSCLKNGNDALGAARWDEAIANFQRASALEPSKQAPLALLANASLSAGHDGEVASAWDKILQIGQSIVLAACPERACRGNSGHLWLSPNQVSFRDGKNQLVFAATPSEVTSLGAARNPRGSAPYFGLRVAGKDYNFYFFPPGFECSTDGVALQCPDAGMREQIVVDNYVAQTIPKLASGAFSQPK